MVRARGKATKKLTVPAGARTAEHPDRPRPWKSSDAAAAARAFLGRPYKAAVRELMEQLNSEDPYAHRCAAEVARLVSQRQPGVLAGCSDLLADAAAEFPDEEWQARGYVMVAAALNARTPAERMRLLPTLRLWLREGERTAVRATALEALLVLGARDAAIREEALEAMEDARRRGIPAMRARAKRMLPMFLRGEARRG